MGEAMEPHGDFRIETINQIIHTYPSSGFNEEGMDRIHKKIEAESAKLNLWGLYEHPSDDSGLTPEAVDRLLTFYKSLEQTSCQFICIDVKDVFKNHVEKIFRENSISCVYVNPTDLQLEKLQNLLSP